MKQYVLFWFRNCLRLADNPGLSAAAKKGFVVPVYILDEHHIPDECTMGPASRWWLHHSLKSLNEDLGKKLNFYRGDASTIIPSLIKRMGTVGVYWNHCYEPWQRLQDESIRNDLLKMGVEHEAFSASLLWDPDSISKSNGDPYQLYRFFTKNALKVQPRKPLQKPRNLVVIKDNEALSLKDLALQSSSDKQKGLEKYWSVGEKGASKRLDTFLKHNLKGYKKERNYPAQRGVSRLSPHLHFGEISPYRIWDAVSKKRSAPKTDRDFFLSELCWREFSYYLLYHFPDVYKKNLRPVFDAFPWRRSKKLLHAWQQGLTGYPFVDAGMRELATTGYMHNRVRMVVGSFLVKNLLIDWRHGRDWFWHSLVDADLANNSVNWQWVAGSGVDAAPYFRIFNPTAQGKKYDPDGMYTKQFVPELSRLPVSYVFEPWKAPDEVLEKAKIILGKTYPKPIVEIDTTRKKALDSYYEIMKKKG